MHLVYFGKKVGICKYSEIMDEITIFLKIKEYNGRYNRKRYHRDINTEELDSIKLIG